MFRDRTALAFVLVIDLAVGAGIGSAEEVDARLEKMPAELTVKNPGPAVTPTLYLIGMPDRAAEPVRKTKGVRLNGVRLTETLLSESVLILYPDGTGQWGYHAGFDIFREPHWQDGRRIDPRTLIEYDKWRYDPLERVYRVGGDMNLLRLYDGRRSRPARYEIAFPPPMLIRTLRVASNCDQLNRPGVVVTVRLWADRSRSELIGQKRVGQVQDAKRFPIVFEDVNCAGVVLELSATDPAGKPVDLYWTFFEAVLDAGGVSLPRLSSGVNHITVEDDPDSSHRVRLVLRWEDRPAADRVWDDFERSGRWRGGSVIKGSRADGLAFTGERFLRVTFPADGRSFGIERPVSGEDWSRFNRIGFAVRARQPAPMRAIALGIRNDEGRFQYLRFKPRARWRFFEFDISRLQRDRVTALRFHWFATPGFRRPEQPCQYDIDSLALWHEEAPSRPAAPPLPEHVARYRSPYDEVTPKARPVPPIQRWFPMGIYDGICSRSDQECRWLFDQMKRLHMNAVYVSNGRVEELERILPLAEARGIRLIYQGTSDGALYYLHLATRTARVQSYERTLAPRAREWIPKFRDRWGLAAWSLTEE
ncbi:MAG: hypothetical protein GXP27_08000, partial [Planctomycetes bacterium]|nr:hypothetical protein [Planctomycetota bacterium]